MEKIYGENLRKNFRGKFPGKIPGENFRGKFPGKIYGKTKAKSVRLLYDLILTKQVLRLLILKNW